MQAGSPLVELDKADTKVTLDQAEAQLAQTVREVRTLFVNNSALNANITARQAEVEKSHAGLGRRQQLIATSAISKEELDHTRAALKAETAALQAHNEQLASNRVLTDKTTIAQHPNVLRAAAQVRNMI